MSLPPKALGRIACETQPVLLIRPSWALWSPHLTDGSTVVGDGSLRASAGGVVMTKSMLFKLPGDCEGLVSQYPSGTDNKIDVPHMCAIARLL